MNEPKLLTQGDLVAIIAPAGPCEQDRLTAGVKTLQSLGLKVRAMKSCHLRHEFLAGTDEARLNDLHSAFADKNIKGIFAARGGYGCQRLLPHINIGLIKRNPKVFIGYSDITALHVFFNQVCNFVTFHGPMPAVDFANPKSKTIKSFCDMVFGHLMFEIPPLNIINPGYATGILTGGNLSILASGLGTPYEINTRGQILFIEEIQEPPYRVDRLFLQLKLAKKFEDAAGIILGDFSPETIDTLKISINEILLPEFYKKNKPIVSGLPCGHSEENITLPLGRKIVLRDKHIYLEDVSTLKV